MADFEFPIVLILRRHPKLHLDNFIPRPGTSPESGAAIHLSGNQVKSTYASPATSQRDEAFGTLWYFRLGRPGIGMPGEVHLYEPAKALWRGLVLERVL